MHHLCCTHCFLNINVELRSLTLQKQTLASMETFHPNNMIGKTISHYKILEKLGGGGMGVVYKAEDTKLKRSVALKFLPPELSRDDEAKERFVHEAQAASALDHPNICTIYEIGETEDEQIFIAMAYYAGETLKKQVARGKLQIADVIDISTQIAQGLAKAHEHGITHRDIKPANVMITKDGLVKILDFGLAKLAGQTRLTKTGMTVGTVAYMSPEQVQRIDADHPAQRDIWSLGVVMYEMLTGRLPFEGEYEQAIMYGIVNMEPEAVRSLKPEVPVDLEQIVNKALEKELAERYQQMDELLVDLRSVSEELEAKPPQATPIAVSFSRRHRLWLYGGVAVILLVLLLLFADQRFLATERGENIRSIAVLPMTNRSTDPDQDHVVDGMTDLLINNLSRLSGLDRVISRTTMMRYKHSDKSLREIGRELEVDALIEASVLSDREQVLVTVNLIEAETERNLWSTSYEREFRDLLRMEREIALVIAQEIKVQLAPHDQARLAEAQEVDPEALDLYLKGLQAREDWLDQQKPILYFAQAIAIDSSFAPAYAGLAIEYALLGGFHGLPGGEVKARQFSQKALSLDASLSEPYIAIGLVRELVDWDWAGAEEAFRHAIELNPGDAFAHSELGQLLMRLGRFEEALKISKQALYLDPLSARWQIGVGAVYLYSGQYDKAITELKKAHELDPNVSIREYLGEAYKQTGMFEEALKLWKAIGWSETGLARYHAVTGHREKALEQVEGWKSRWSQGAGTTPEGWSIPWSIAWIYADLGEKDQALDWLEQAYEAHSGDLVYVKVDPGFYSLRGEPRFQALLEKIGFPK